MIYTQLCDSYTCGPHEVVVHFTVRQILLTGYCSCVETPGVTDEDVVLAGVTPLNVASAFGHVQLVTALISNTVAAQVGCRAQFYLRVFQF